MSAYKSSLLAAAAAGAMIVGLGAPASAFDRVNWNWDLQVTENVAKNINIGVDFDPTGVVLLENVQAHIGNLSATSTVNGVYNNQPANGAGGEVDLGSIYINAPFHGWTNDIIPGGSTVNGDVVDGATVTNGHVFEDGNRVTLNVDLGTVEVPAGDASFDARTQLPEVVSAATAVANNASIESDVMVEVHEGQFVFGGPTGDPIDALVAGIGGVLLGSAGIDNTNHLVGAGILLGAATGVIAPAQISAVSSVANILNASVDSAATAVANNMSIEVEPRGYDDAIVMGDVTQVSFANLSASSSVSNVSLNDYTNLGIHTNALNRPIVSSVATAVGNNLSIKVGNLD